jgi:NAD(P)-dependent dehydrogenase (short-subunit alcohol dehydrogenase family)
MTFNIDLTEKTALITGASSGIGAEIAVTLAKAGAGVAIVGRDDARLNETAKRVADVGGTAIKISADLTADGAAEAVVQAAVDGLGKLTTVINAAGIFEPAPIDAGVDYLDRALAINVRAPYALSAAALPHLRANKGSLLFVSSIGGHMGFPGVAAYGASKGAIELLVKCLAVEEAPNGVRVAAVAPGNVRTPMNAHLFADPAYEAQEIALTPLGRIGEVHDIAPAIAFLASDYAAYITGASLVIDGGVVAS